jgi:hypothetical protein
MRIAIGLCAILLCLFTCETQAAAPESLTVVTLPYISGIPQWSPEPCFSRYTPHGTGTCGTCSGFSVPADAHDDFDQTWGSISCPASRKIQISYTTCGGVGKIRFYLVTGSCSGDGVLVLEILQPSLCHYEICEINLSSYGLLAGQEYYIRVWMPANTFGLRSFKITPVPMPTAVDNTTWGRIKGLYR